MILKEIHGFYPRKEVYWWHRYYKEKMRQPKVDVNVKVEETGCTCFFQAGIQRQPIKNLIAPSVVRC